MGCGQSKIENEEAVTRCKEWMKDVVSSRNAFAAAHSSYAVSLKNTGAALSDYAEGEVPPSGRHSSTTAAAADSASSSTAPPVGGAVAIQPPMEKLPPPPPPLPDYPPTPLQRSASLPELRMPKLKKKAPVGASIREEEDDEDTAAAADDVPSTPPRCPCRQRRFRWPATSAAVSATA